MTDPITAALFARLVDKRFREAQIIADHANTDTTTGR